MSDESRATRGDLDLRGLVGIPYADADCWGVVVKALARLRVFMPIDQAEAVRRADELVEVLPADAAVRTGDVLQFAPGEDGRTHVGLVVDARGERFLHAMGRGDGKPGGRMSALCRVGVWRSKVARVLRPRALAEKSDERGRVHPVPDRAGDAGQCGARPRRLLQPEPESSAEGAAAPQASVGVLSGGAGGGSPGICGSE